VYYSYLSMEREIKDVLILKKFCTDFCSVVDRYAGYIVVSGFVVIASGRARGTVDIDMIIERISKEKFVQMHNDLIAHGFVCMQSDDTERLYNDYLSQNSALRYTFDDLPLPEMEMKFAKDELDTFQLVHRQKIPLTGIDVWFSSIEMNIAFKEEYLKSEKDIEDATYLRKIYPVNERVVAEYKKMIKTVKYAR